MSIAELKYLYKKHISGFYKDYVKLIKLHFLIFAIYSIVKILLISFNEVRFIDILNNNLLYPTNIKKLVYKPWTLITYIFIPRELLSLIFNMIFLYNIGVISNHLVGPKRTFSIYMSSSIASGIILVFILNKFEIFENKFSWFVGPLPSIYGLLIAISTFAPNFPINLSFFGIVRLKNITYILLIYLLYILSIEKSIKNYLSIIASLWGYMYIKFLQNGIDIGKFFDLPFNLIIGLFAKKTMFYSKEKKPLIQNKSRVLKFTKNLCLATFIGFFSTTL